MKKQNNIGKTKAIFSCMILFQVILYLYHLLSNINKLFKIISSEECWIWRSDAIISKPSYTSGVTRIPAETWQWDITTWSLKRQTLFMTVFWKKITTFKSVFIMLIGVFWLLTKPWLSQKKKGLSPSLRNFNMKTSIPLVK